MISTVAIKNEKLEMLKKVKNRQMTAEQADTQLLGLAIANSRSVLESDKRIVYEMGTTMANYTLMSAYEYGTIHDFGEKAGIINTRNYMTVINRLRKALESLWLEGRCERMKYCKGYTYDFTKSLGNGY